MHATRPHECQLASTRGSGQWGSQVNRSRDHRLPLPRAYQLSGPTASLSPSGSQHPPPHFPSGSWGPEPGRHIGSLHVGLVGPVRCRFSLHFLLLFLSLKLFGWRPRRATIAHCESTGQDQPNDHFTCTSARCWHAASRHTTALHYREEGNEGQCGCNRGWRDHQRVGEGTVASVSNDNTNNNW